MNLEEITPVVLTLNEEANIGRCLGRLAWARRVVVIDSGSQDRTAEIVASYANTAFIVRQFDSHARQWNFGVSRAETDWVLCLDADYMIPPEWVDEVRECENERGLSAYLTSFVYQIFGHPLGASLYPPRPVLFDRQSCSYWDDGHTQRLQISGPVGELRNSLAHDDRKSLSKWFESQLRYARLEAVKLLSADPEKLDRVDRIRLIGGPAVLFTPLYCLLFKGLLFQGWPGWYYTLQRTLAELLLNLEILDQRLRK